MNKKSVESKQDGNSIEMYQLVLEDCNLQENIDALECYAS